MNRFHTDVKSFMENAILTVYVRVITALFTWYISKNQINTQMAMLNVLEDLEAAKKIVAGTARSMGIQVE